MDQVTDRRLPTILHGGKTEFPDLSLEVGTGSLSLPGCESGYYDGIPSCLFPPRYSQASAGGGTVHADVTWSESHLSLLETGTLGSAISMIRSDPCLLSMSLYERRMDKEKV